MDASKIVKADTAEADPLGAPRKCLRDAARDPGRVKEKSSPGSGGLGNKRSRMGRIRQLSVSNGPGSTGRSSPDAQAPGGTGFGCGGL